MKKRIWIYAAMAMVILCGRAMAAVVPAHELKAGDAAYLAKGKPGQLQLVKDCFGPGEDGVTMNQDQDPVKNQLRWTVKDVPEGDYYVGLPLTGHYWMNGYEGFYVYWYQGFQLYLNDRRIVFTDYTETLKPENAAASKITDNGGRALYQIELRVMDPVHLKAGDVLQIILGPNMQITFGPIRLYKTAPDGNVGRLPTPDWGKAHNALVSAGADEPKREGNTVSQSVWFHNQGTRPRVFKTTVEATDYLQAALLRKQEEIAVQPGEKVVRTYQFDVGTYGRTRFTLVATNAEIFPDLRLVKYYVDDRHDGPRPNTCLNGEWEVCMAPGVEPADAPPAGAEWKKVTVPNNCLQSTKTNHMAWYRKTFDAPAYIQGERIILKFDQILSEAWIYVNGKFVSNELHAYQPFEVDITSAFKPGQKNDLLVQCRDWLSYSPVNKERVKRGESYVYKDNMIDVAEYIQVEKVGVSGCVYLEGRPAVSVDDVFIATSVQEKKLTLRYRLANKTAAEQEVLLTPTILDEGKAYRTLAARTVKVPAGSNATITVQQAWPDAKYWWPKAPHLYVLKTDLKTTSGAGDTQIQRFGFRELWIDGIHFMLNGIPYKIRSCWANGSSGIHAANPYWEPAKRYEAMYGVQTRAMFENNQTMTRSFVTCSTGIDEALEVTDESGILATVMSAVNQFNFTFDERFWKHVLACELRMIDAYKNHPSIVIWKNGNECMWGLLYQGEAAKTISNEWQVRICKAMWEYDLQKRLNEWDSDNDLFGRWTYYATHYPREMTSHPDLPNSAWWGPLDGTTVVPNNMGDIVLGTKPLCVGESFWPASLNRPYGGTIIQGDDAYIGGNYWYMAWIDSSQFILNGYRDVEFAYIDIYCPLTMIKPQTIVFKEETGAFYGGRKIQRHLNVHNDTRKAIKATLRWTLASEGRILDGGRSTFKLGPAGLKRLVVNVKLPRVNGPQEAVFTAQLLERAKLLHEESRVWQIHPAFSVGVPEALKLAVYDPAGDTIKMLKSINVPFVELAELKAPEGGALIIGRKAIRNLAQGPWRESLSAFVRSGGKALILEQEESPDFIPVTLEMSKKNRTTMSYVRAADHPVMAGLTDAAMRWWADDHYVSHSNYRKPIKGNWLPLVDVGTGDGIIDTPLLEEYDGQGSYLLCQMLLTDKVGVAPQAGVLLQNILNYLAGSACYRVVGRTALIAAQDSPLKKCLDESKLVYEDISGKLELISKDKFDVVILDMARFDNTLAEPLAKFVRAGGRVMLHRAQPEQQAALEQLLGAKLRFFDIAKESSDIQHRVLRNANVGLLAGISNHEFFWASNPYLTIIRSEGNWGSGYWPTGGPPSEFVADYYVFPSDEAASKVNRLTRPGALLQVPQGSGYFLLNQLRLDEPVTDTANVIRRLRSLLLTNLGCTMREDDSVQRARAQRLGKLQFTTVDLGPYANRGFKDDKANGIVGWSNQGEFDMRDAVALYGRHVLNGVPFFVCSPKSVITLYSISGVNRDLPKEVKGIKIGRKADEIFFLHDSCWTQGKVCTYRVNYEDGTSADVEIYDQKQVVDWIWPADKINDAMINEGVFVAWKGYSPAFHTGTIIQGLEWKNPHPDKVVRDIDFIGSADDDYKSVPILIGITTAVEQTNQGIVADVIGVSGVRVKLGSEEKDIYYIGVAGLPEDHPYYKKAVEQHKKLVVGQKVTVEYDVVSQNATGQAVAYVFLAQEANAGIGSMVNGKIIGAGLSKVGNFEGNIKHKMYLENLGFIAQQGKAGLWATEAK